MHAKPRRVIGRDAEWSALTRFLDRGQRLAMVYGPRRSGKSFLLEALCEVTGARRHQALTGTVTAQLDDVGDAIGDWLGAGRLALDSWNDAFARLVQLDVPAVVLDEFPYLVESDPSLPSVVQRYLDDGRGPALILSGSAMSTMADLLAARAPLFGRAATIVVPRAFRGAELRRLWSGVDPATALWIDAVVGGLPGYRPLLPSPDGDLDSWMVEDVLAASSPLLDAADTTLADLGTGSGRALTHSILDAIAMGERVFSDIARAVGRPTSALSRPLTALERAGLVCKVGDPLRPRRTQYEVADAYLRFWFAVVRPHRSQLQAGRAGQVWRRVATTTFRDQVLGPRWEAVARTHVSDSDLDAVGFTILNDRAGRTAHEVDIVGMRGGEVALLGEAKLRRLGTSDADRLRRVRDLLDADGATLVLASADGVDPAAARAPDVTALTPKQVYG